MKEPVLIYKKELNTWRTDGIFVQQENPALIQQLQQKLAQQYGENNVAILPAGFVAGIEIVVSAMLSRMEDVNKGAADATGDGKIIPFDGGSK